jgi:beta-lactamase superfamily II metal-dependent hydrolase
MATRDLLRSAIDSLTPAMLVAAPVALEAVEHLPASRPPPAAVVAAAPVSQPSRVAPATAMAASSGTLSMFSIDIGQGDASAVLGPPDAQGRRRTLVMDAGNLRPDGGRIVSEFLTSQGVKAVDYVVLSHFDADHLGGFVTVGPSTSLLWDNDCHPTQFFPRERLFDNGGTDKTTQSVTEWKRCTTSDSVPTRVEHVQGGNLIGEVLDLGGAYTATIVAGDGFVLGNQERIPDVDTDNERSVAILVSGPNDFDALITGDLIGQAHAAEDARLEGALGAELQKRKIRVDVLRCGHHGAANASERSFLEAIRPEVFLISTGKNNFGHPADRTYQTLNELKIPVVVQTESGAPKNPPPAPLHPLIANGTVRIDVTNGEYRVSTVGPVSPVNGFASADFNFACSVERGCQEGKAAPECCRVCRVGKACGDTCISQAAECLKGAGCACDP